MITVQYVAGAALGLLVFVSLTNFVVFLYARGVIRAATDEGARAGGRFGAGVEVCEARGETVLRPLKGGHMARVTFACEERGDSLDARATVTLRGWLRPLTPDWHFTVVGRSTREDPT